MRSGRAIGFALVGLLGALLTAEALGLRLNLAESMPVGLYRLAPCGEGVGAALSRGDLVAIDTGVAARSNARLRFFRDRGYLTFTGSPRDLLLKQVVGLGGDVVDEVARAFAHCRSCVERRCVVSKKKRPRRSVASHLVSVSRASGRALAPKRASPRHRLAILWRSSH